MKKIIWVITFIPLILTCVVLQFMPDRVPMHYGISGEIDRWGSKYENLILPAFVVCMTIFFMCLISLFKKKACKAESDKQRAEELSNAKVLEIIALVNAIGEGILHCVLLYKAYVRSDAGAAYPDIDILRATGPIFGAMMIVLGNFLPKCKRNSIVGFRATWTMYNDVTWSKSNRFAGPAMMIAGVCTIVTSAFVGEMIPIVMMLVFLSIAIAVSLGYAHKVYLEEKGKAEA